MKIFIWLFLGWLVYKFFVFLSKDDSNTNEFSSKDRELNATSSKLEKAKELLDKSFYAEADCLFFDEKDQLIKKYYSLKQKYILGFFNDNFPSFEGDNEKASAISNFSPAFLLTARAGTGKTSSIFLKISLLIEKYSASKNDMLVLTFNKNDYKNKLFDFFSDTEYLSIDENSTTLRGEIVKSKGERYIADFLFLHGIKYQYEKGYIWNGRVYKPDFTIYAIDKMIILEHWGIDENDKKSISPSFEITWEEYKSQMDRKRDFWKNKNKYIFIETSIKDMFSGQTHFNSILETKLEKLGLLLKMCPKEKLIKDFYPKVSIRLLHFVSRFIFVRKTKKQNIIHDNDLFKFCNIVYSSYEKLKRKDVRIDFYDLLDKCIKKINKSKGQCYLLPKNQNFRTRLSELKYIFIDEYQDFSPLFDKIIRTIQKYNEELMLFCVGDNCQAINGFAGSDIIFFDNFRNLNQTSDIGILRLNYRNSKEIVDFGNDILNLNEEEKSLTKLSEKTGFIKLFYIEKTNIDSDEIFMIENKYKNLYLFSKYAKVICDIALRNPNKSIYVLHRKNHLYSFKISEMERKIKIILRKIEPTYQISKIAFMTTHASKGKESDIVILLEANKNNFPLIHPDEKLLGSYGRTKKEIEDEEKRLFYVACTRAKEQLYIFTIQGEESTFIPSGHFEYLEGKYRTKIFFTRFSRNLIRNMDNSPTKNLSVIKKAVKDEFVAIDIETTGFSNDDHIIEIAAIRFQSGKPTESFVSLVNPLIAIPNGIADITGINDDMLSNAPMIENVFSSFIDFIANSKLVAHNSSFDMRFLQKYAQEYAFKINNDVECTLQLSRSAIPELNNHKLRTIANYFEIKVDNCHRAELDAIATGYIYLNCLKIKHEKREIKTKVSRSPSIVRSKGYL